MALDPVTWMLISYFVPFTLGIVTAWVVLNHTQRRPMTLAVTTVLIALLLSIAGVIGATFGVAAWLHYRSR